jgi:hypothetical protein
VVRLSPVLLLYDANVLRGVQACLAVAVSQDKGMYYRALFISGVSVHWVSRVNLTAGTDFVLR